MLYRIENLLKERDRAGGFRLRIRSLRVPKGARLAVTGPSGCGKSTALDILGLALEPDSADVFTFSPGDAEHDVLRIWRDASGDAPAALRLAHMGYVLQTGGLLPFLSVADNMTVTARLSGMAEEEALESASRLAAHLGIGHLMNAMPATLSVGERQRAAIARALAPKPQLILADEPTAALDPLNAARVMEAFLGAVDEQGGALVLVTHNAGWAREGGLVELPFALEQRENGVTAVLDDGGAADATGEANAATSPGEGKKSGGGGVTRRLVGCLLCCLLSALIAAAGGPETSRAEAAAAKAAAGRQLLPLLAEAEKSAATSTEKPEEIASAKKPEEIASAKKLEEIASAEKPEETASTEKPEKTASAKKPEETASAKKPEEIASAKKPEKTASAKKPEEIASAEKPEETASAEKPEKTASTEKPEKTASTEKPEKTGSGGRFLLFWPLAALFLLLAFSAGLVWILRRIWLADTELRQRVLAAAASARARYRALFRKLRLSASFARRDWLHEGALSLCAVLALAGMLTPLLVMQGLKNGLMNTLRDDLLRDPEILLVTPERRNFPASFVRSLADLEGVSFVVGRSAFLSQELVLRKDGGSGKEVKLEPWAPGHPLLERYRKRLAGLPEEGPEPGLVLSADAARKLEVNSGDLVFSTLERGKLDDKPETLERRFRVAGILPEAALFSSSYAPPPVFIHHRELEAIEDWFAFVDTRRAAPDRERIYSSFLLFTRDLDSVEPLAAALEARDVPVTTRAKKIADTRKTDETLGLVIRIVSLAVGAGFVAFTVSSVQGAVRRKNRMLGMLRLLGFPRAALLLYPLVQALLTAAAGTACAFALYLAVAFSIDRAFAAAMGGEAACSLGAGECFAAAGIIAALVVLSAFRASLLAAKIEPSAVLRDV